MPKYTREHAEKGLADKMPSIETWPNQFPGYEITIEQPEFTSVCPKTGLPDFGMLVLRYEPDKKCLELKSFKEYLLAYRELGIFYENAVNRILRDVVKDCKPRKASLTGVFNARGGMSTTVLVTYAREGGFGS
jgi:7-cyano-7-deazaguanine reductase